MADRLTYSPRFQTPADRLNDARHESTDALVEALELLQQLHEHRVLETLLKLTKGGEGLLATTLHTLEGDSATNLFRNVIEIARLTTELDPTSLRSLSMALDAGVREGAKRVEKGEGVGLGELLGLLRDKDIQIALGALFGTLKGFGRALRDASEVTHETPGQRRPNEVQRK